MSGRGVGLDAVQDMVKQVRGTVRVTSQAGKGTRFQLQLPVTLSVVRTLLVEIGGEPYAFPLAYIVRTLKLPKDKIERARGPAAFRASTAGTSGWSPAHQVLGGRRRRPSPGDELPVIVVGDQHHAYGLRRRPVSRRARAGRAAARRAARQDQGHRRRRAHGRRLAGADRRRRGHDPVDGQAGVRRPPERQSRRTRRTAAEKKRKRVLVVDDSLTVRELERKLLGNRGYEVEVAVDGMDGWNAVRTGHFDLVVTDIDMPRMDGIELVG